MSGRVANRGTVRCKVVQRVAARSLSGNARPGPSERAVQGACDERLKQGVHLKQQRESAFLARRGRLEAVAQQQAREAEDLPPPYVRAVERDRVPGQRYTRQDCNPVIDEE